MYEAAAVTEFIKTQMFRRLNTHAKHKKCKDSIGYRNGSKYKKTKQVDGYSKKGLKGKRGTKLVRTRERQADVEEDN